MVHSQRHAGEKCLRRYACARRVLRLLRLPLFGLLLMVVNCLLGAWLHPRQRLLAGLLWVGGAVVPLVLLVGVLRLVA